ncbi:MAG: aminodeoxychorismate/anthranilate synthase component II [Candidatus Micrarchaeota archaeon]|nr:aminodeoxychorismate/anthranilate synthase component II [Candidatus Micrarchaeota archaeon]
MKLLLIDNFDSFVYNIYQYLGELGQEVDVIRNDKIAIDEILKQKYNGIIISPGPGTPENKKDFGICRDVITKLGNAMPILGVCLGHQGIVSCFGGKIIRAKKPMHGKMSLITHNQKGIFEGVKNPLKVMRYHSLIGEEVTLPKCLEITAKSQDDGVVMAIQHTTLQIYGVQFHPESILTEDGKKILENFCKICGVKS